MNQLQTIIEHKRREIDELRQSMTIEYLQSAASIRRKPLDFREALSAAPMGLIAEIKRKSPSAGDIRADMNVALIASQYQEAGANAVSVLMDKEFFGGGEADFVAVRNAISLPMLYKEFVLCDWQVWHAASLGASAVLLIAAVLSDDELKDLSELIQKTGLTALVEVHTEEELDRVLNLGATCVGVNNRDLRTFQTNVDTSIELAGRVSGDVLMISESGIRTPDDVLRLRDAGYQGILVGEQLLRQPDVGEGIRQLMSGVWASS